VVFDVDFEVEDEVAAGFGGDGLNLGVAVGGA
jgi:hypothetical protein